MLDGVDFQTDPKRPDISVRYQSTICFDVNNDKGSKRQPDDFCHTYTVNNEFGKPVMSQIAPKKFDSEGNPSHLDLPSWTFRDGWGFGSQNDQFESSDHLIYEIRVPKKMLKSEGDIGFTFEMYFDSAHDELVQLVDGVVWPSESSKDEPSTWGTLFLPHVECQKGLELIFKASDGSPACVKPETKQKLIERGWTGVVLPSIGSTTRTERQDIPVTYGGPTDIPGANNQFALRFYSHISQDDKEGNIFFSPTSILTAFAIAYEGAQGNTATEMEQVFGFEPEDSARHEGFANMQQRLNFEGQNNTLSIANALWLAKNFEPYDDYVSNVENYYSGKVESVDFASKEKSLDIINQWIHDNTSGKIEKIFETLDPETNLAITNAIYFKGIWEEPFEKDRTATAPFHVGDGLTVNVPMMELKTTYLNQTETPTARILELPYEGSKTSMLILLPNEIDGLRALEDSLSAENIGAWQEDYTKIKTKAYIPKFKLETDYDLIPPLVGLGVHDAFGNADFSGISELDLFIYKAAHKAIVEVNEEGTEAAAATGMAMLDSGPVEFRADHPFVFVIQDNETGQILFMGRVTDPTK
jgi:serpin B